MKIASLIMIRNMMLIVLALSLIIFPLISEIDECQEEIEKLEYRILADTVEIEGYRKHIEFKEDVISGLINRINND